MGSCEEPHWLARTLAPVVAGLGRGARALGVLDPRSLAFFRIMLGGLIVLDVALRFIDLRAFYTDFGVLPRTVVIERHNPAAHFSFLMSSGSAWFQAAVLFSAAIAGACLAVGYRTRLAAVASWVLLVSIQYRNPLILQGGDVLFRILVLFAVVLPVSAAWSFDKRSSRAVALQPSVLHFAYVAQIACVYLVTGFAKYRNVEWKDGLGGAYPFWLQQYTTWLGDLVGALPLPVLQAINYGVLVVEIALPLFLFLPWRVPVMRSICFVVMVGFHVVILFTLKVGLFSLISIVAWLPLLPAGFWEGLAARFGNRPGCDFLRLDQGFDSSIAPSWKRSIKHLLGTLMLSFLLVWNSGNIFSSWRATLRTPILQNLALFFGLDQSWEMFSRPISSDGWIVIPAVRTDGSLVDLFSGREYIGPDRPTSLSASFPGDRWRKYWRNMLGGNSNYQRLGLGRYLCRLGEEEEDPKRRIEALQIIFIRETIAPNGIHAAPEKVLLWNHECRDGLIKKWEKKLPFALLPFPKSS